MWPRAPLPLHQSWNVRVFSSYSQSCPKSCCCCCCCTKTGRADRATAWDGSVSPLVMTGFISGWDGERTHTPPIQEILSPLRHWANRRWDLKKPERSDPSTSSRFLHVTLSETTDNHYPAPSCLVMSPPHPAQITLSFLFNIPPFLSQATCICWELIPRFMAILSPGAAPQIWKPGRAQPPGNKA